MIYSPHRIASHHITFHSLTDIYTMYVYSDVLLAATLRVKQLRSRAQLHRRHNQFAYYSNTFFALFFAFVNTNEHNTCTLLKTNFVSQLCSLVSLSFVTTTACGLRQMVNTHDTYNATLVTLLLYNVHPCSPLHKLCLRCGGVCSLDFR